MEYLVQPTNGVSPLDCNCYCKSNSVMAYDPCTSKCTTYCSTYEVCRTPTGPKMYPTGVNPKE